MSKQASNNNGGIGFVGLLTILFIGLKLTGYVDWSWFWVLSPVIFSVCLAAVAIVTVVFMSASKK